MMKKRLMMGAVSLACLSFIGGFTGARYMIEARVMGQNPLPEPVNDDLPTAFEEVNLKHQRSDRYTWDQSNSVLSTAAGTRDAGIRADHRRIQTDPEMDLNLDSNRVFADDGFAKLTEEAETIAIAQRDADQESPKPDSY